MSIIHQWLVVLVLMCFLGFWYLYWWWCSGAGGAGGGVLVVVTAVVRLGILIVEGLLYLSVFVVGVFLVVVVRVVVVLVVVGGHTYGKQKGASSFEVEDGPEHA